MACINISGGTNTLMLRAELNNTMITFGDDVHYDGHYCGKYALYYQNIYGGWDAFLIEGSVIKSNKVSDYKYSKSFDNTTLDKANWVYAKDITVSYACTTGWLSDEESKRLAKHLLSSPDIYLHEFESDKIIPVNITDTSYKIKTYQNEGKKLVNYVINLEEGSIKTRQY